MNRPALSLVRHLPCAECYAPVRVAEPFEYPVICDHCRSAGARALGCMLLALALAVVASLLWPWWRAWL